MTRADDARGRPRASARDGQGSRRQRLGGHLRRTGSHRLARRGVARAARVVVGRDGACSRIAKATCGSATRAASNAGATAPSHRTRASTPSWPAASDRCSATPADRVWFAPASGGLYWLRDGRVGAVAALRDDVIYSIAGDGDARPGRQAARRDDARARAGDTFRDRDVHGT